MVLQIARGRDVIGYMNAVSKLIDFETINPTARRSSFNADFSFGGLFFFFILYFIFDFFIGRKKLLFLQTSRSFTKLLELSSPFLGAESISETISASITSPVGKHLGGSLPRRDQSHILLRLPLDHLILYA